MAEREIITTQEVLDALPVGSAVLDPNEGVFVKVSPFYEDQPAPWVGNYLVGAISFGDWEFPLTLLYRPDQPTPSTTVTAERVEAAARAIRVTREFQAGASFGIPADAHQQAAEGMARAALGITVEGGEQRG